MSKPKATKGGTTITDYEVERGTFLRKLYDVGEEMWNQLYPSYQVWLESKTK